MPMHLKACLQKSTQKHQTYYIKLHFTKATVQNKKKKTRQFPITDNVTLFEKLLSFSPNLKFLLSQDINL